ncbi:MAG: hypothetical protein QOG01_4281, partial [Pseudonocardiales bacterium]|nr:hypothetical protein [Pseudonocardiales bacterium]
MTALADDPTTPETATVDVEIVVPVFNEEHDLEP